MSDRTERKRHPSTNIPDETLRELSYRVYLLRLEPPMTPEESLALTRMERNRLIDDEARRRASKGMDSLTRAYLRVLVDMGLVKV